MYQLAVSSTGVKLSEVYDAAVEFVKKEKPAMVDKLTKNAGFVI